MKSILSRVKIPHIKMSLYLPAGVLVLWEDLLYQQFVPPGETLNFRCFFHLHLEFKTLEQRLSIGWPVQASEPFLYTLQPY